MGIIRFTAKNKLEAANVMVLNIKYHKLVLQTTLNIKWLMVKYFFQTTKSKEKIRVLLCMFLPQQFIIEQKKIARQSQFSQYVSTTTKTCHQISNQCY
jgi:hypothetical protein